MKSPTITTIIPTYRRPQFLKKAIQSVLSQTYSHFQLWVCDNASGDETAQIVAEFAKDDPRVKYVCHEKNIGMLANYHFGLSLVDTDFFSFLSDDDVLLCNFYETVLEEFKKHPEAGFVAASTIIMTEKGQPIRVPLSYWPREGKFNPPEGVKEMIGKYPVPTSILFSKRVIEHTTIDFDNPTFWDCDYLLQIASIFPIVISKKHCALFRHHMFSYSNQNDLALHEDAFGALIKAIRKNKKLTIEQAETAVNLILLDLAQCRKHYFLDFLTKKKFEDAKKIVELISSHPFYKGKVGLYYFIIKLCKLFPATIFCLQLIRTIRRSIKSLKISTNSTNKEYIAILLE